ncbi:unnamed protein product [Rotaria sp. Silwood2]|nr:unnamed protein product [Rotaria sp. Silwood2]CAF2751897.1 unnamed protein product [Rotaria sp. Silwood2]CAF3972102.1 unnamed protein product [Rotaria sp. Silwood2]CAF4328683.1 unnamed protein product [Rotaria sp. Silwood2]CAF4482188.1 unnamed protein product [Rotaria sp. Silwood2]
MILIKTIWRCIQKYLPLLSSLIFFLIFFYINAVVTTIADRIAPYYRPALPDIGHKLLPYWSYFQINNYMIIIAYVFIFIRFLPQSDIRVTVFRRWFFVQGVMFGMRSISIYVTSLTVPQPGCITNITELATPPVEAFYVMFGIRSTCGDVLFSGHTVALTICALCWTTYSRAEEYRPFLFLYRKCGCTRQCHCSEWLIRPKLDAVGDPMTLYLTTYLVWFYSIVGYFLIIATRFHYTVDVFLGCLLTVLTWYTYHSYVKRLLEKRRFIIARIFIWFEGLEGDASTSISLLNGPVRDQLTELGPAAVVSAGDARY